MASVVHVARVCKSSLAEPRPVAAAPAKCARSLQLLKDVVRRALSWRLHQPH